MAQSSTIYLGTELKLNLHIEPIIVPGDTLHKDVTLHMDDYNFTVWVYASSIKKAIVITKGQCIRVGKDDRIMRVDTAALGTGVVTCKVEAQIPDKDFKDKFKDEFRTEVVQINTGLIIVRA